MNTKNMTRDEKIQMLTALQKDLGWYPLMTMCVEDLKDRIEGDGLPMPPDDVLHQACAYVARKYEFDASYAFDWAVEYATEGESK